MRKILIICIDDEHKVGAEMNMVIDYSISDQCENEKAWYICHKCGKCGRKFENGFMYDDGGTTVTDDEEQE